MKKKMLAIALLGLATAAQAEHHSSAYIGVLGSYVDPDNARGVDDDAYGASLLFGFPGKWLTPEINFSWTQFDRNVGPTDDNYSLGLDLRMNFAPKAPVNPFLLIGGGGVFEDSIPDDPEERIVGFANAGGGLMIPLGNSRASLRLEGRRVVTFTDEVVPGRDRLYDTRASAGLQWAFGDHEEPAPAPVVEPAPHHPQPPEVVDSDRDGVPDTTDRCPGTIPGVKVDEVGCPLPPPDSDADGVVDTSDMCPDTPRGLRVDSRGCAIKAQTLVLRNINFEFDKATLTADSRTALDEIARGLKGQPTMQVTLEGHTDAKGSDAYNLRLSRERANAVRDYLISQGVEAARLRAEGHGETRPVADNTTEEGRAQNRRVEFKVMKE